MSMSVGVVDGSVDEGLSTNREIGVWKISRCIVRQRLNYEEYLARYIPNLWSFSAASEASLSASDRV